jgi:hypothetical protein
MVQMERAIDVPQTLIQYDAKATCNQNFLESLI